MVGGDADVGDAITHHGEHRGEHAADRADFPALCVAGLGHGEVMAE